MTTRRLSGRRGRAASPALDLTPMVDVVFLLVLFFMVSTTFITSETGLPVDLPQAQSSVARPADLPTVTVTADQRLFLGGAEMSTDDLGATLAAMIQATGYTTVVLRADSQVPHGFAVQVMDLIKQSGAQSIAIATGQ